MCSRFLSFRKCVDSSQYNFMISLNVGSIDLLTDSHLRMLKKIFINFGIYNFLKLIDIF